MGVSHDDRRRQERPRARESTIMRGRAHLYPRPHISAEEILPVLYHNGDGEAGLGRHALKGIDPGFAARVAKGDILPFTPFAMEIIEAGGLLPYVLRQTTGASSA